MRLVVRALVVGMVFSLLGGCALFRHRHTEPPLTVPEVYVRPVAPEGRTAAPLTAWWSIAGRPVSATTVLDEDTCDALAHGLVAHVQEKPSLADPWSNGGFEFRTEHAEGQERVAAVARDDHHLVWLLGDHPVEPCVLQADGYHLQPQFFGQWDAPAPSRPGYPMFRID